MQTFSVENWSACDFSDSSVLGEGDNIHRGMPELAGLKPLVKRRMPLLAKGIQGLRGYCSAVHFSSMPTVYASKNAELSKTIKIIKQYGGEISPTLFSMSVHNAIPGLLSVINRDHNPYTAIDSLSGVVEMAVFEAVSWLNEYPRVKVVYFEESTPDVLAGLNPHPDTTMVMQLVLTKGSDYSLRIVANGANPNLSEMTGPSNLFCRQYLSLFKAEVDQVSLNTARNTWYWNRCSNQ